MTIGIRFRTYALLTLALLVSTLILPGTTLATDSTDSESDILENVRLQRNR